MTRTGQGRQEVGVRRDTRPVKRPDFDRPAARPGRDGAWWNSGRQGSGDRTNWRNNQVNINNNFKNNINWSTNRNHWGHNPWWNRPANRHWYRGSWNCGWNRHYYHHHRHYYHRYYWGSYWRYRPWPGYFIYDDDDYFYDAIGWGLLGWSLGTLAYNSGYYTYANPYPAEPVGRVTYTEPISIVAGDTAPAEDEVAKITERSESLVEESQAAFKPGDYLRALEFANKAVEEAPGDGALHEYRALVLFALGKYSEAAGVLNPVLAGGPGWDWTTMISLYNSRETYTSQLEALEKYSKAKPDGADAHFLLGYHYMVCNQLERATAEFDAAAKLQPADTISAQLRDLTKASTNSADDDKSADSETPAEAPPPPAPVPLEKLTGTWVSDRGPQGTVTLVFKEGGKFAWTFKKGEKTSEFGGSFSINETGLLVLDAEQSQMVAAVELPKDNEMKFVLAGGPPDDPGLIFAKK